MFRFQFIVYGTMPGEMSCVLIFGSVGAVGMELLCIRMHGE